jgi:hypothetical protein
MMKSVHQQFKEAAMGDTTVKLEASLPFAKLFEVALLTC